MRSDVGKSGTKRILLLVLFGILFGGATRFVVAEERRPPGRLYTIPSVTRPDRARSLRILSRAANWDADADADGIEVTVMPLAESGAVVPVEGQLSVSLIGQKSRRRHAREDTTESLGLWTQRIRRTDFIRGGALYRFPFQSPNPTTDPSLAATGFLHVRLSASAHGRLEAQTPIPLQSDRGPAPSDWMK